MRGKSKECREVILQSTVVSEIEFSIQVQRDDCFCRLGYPPKIDKDCFYGIFVRRKMFLWEIAHGNSKGQ